MAVASLSYIAEYNTLDWLNIHGIYQTLEVKRLIIKDEFWDM